MVIVAAVFLLPSAANENDKIQGTIKKIDLVHHEFVLEGKYDGKEYAFKLDPAAKVQLNDRAGRLAGLRVGDDATVTFRREGAQLLATEIMRPRK